MDCPQSERIGKTEERNISPSMPLYLMINLLILIINGKYAADISATSLLFYLPICLYATKCIRWVLPKRHKSQCHPTRSRGPPFRSWNLFNQFQDWRESKWRLDMNLQTGLCRRSRWFWNTDLQCVFHAMSSISEGHFLLPFTIRRFGSPFGYPFWSAKTQVAGICGREVHAGDCTGGKCTAPGSCKVHRRGKKDF